MPVENHDSSEQVKRSSDTPYGCKGRIIAGGYWLKVREYYSNEQYEMVDRYIPHTMSGECRYSSSLTDPRCATCDLRGEGEKYDQLIRSRGT